MTASREEILDLLDDVSAAFENTMAHFGNQMPHVDRISRQELVNKARELCDRELRPEDAGDDEIVRLARDAGYDGSPGGEAEWLEGNGIAAPRTSTAAP